MYGVKAQTCLKKQNNEEKLDLTRTRGLERDNDEG